MIELISPLDPIHGVAIIFSLWAVSFVLSLMAGRSVDDAVIITVFAGLLQFTTYLALTGEIFDPLMLPMMTFLWVWTGLTAYACFGQETAFEKMNVKVNQVIKDILGE